MRRIIAGVLAAAAFLALAPCLAAQEGFFTREDVIKYTPEWHGERFADGRPKVPDDILDRMKNVTLEEAWATLRSAGFNHQYEDGWYCIHPDQVLVGRALTAMWMPGRPDVQKVIEDQGSKGQSQGSDECMAGGHAAAARCLCCRPFRTEGGWPVDRRQRGQRHLCEIRERHRLRWRRARHQRPERAAKLHHRSSAPTILPITSARSRAAQAELDDGRHQRSDAHRACAGDARRCDSGPKWRGALHTSATCREGRQVFGAHSPSRHVRPPAAAGKEVHRADRSMPSGRPKSNRTFTSG